MASQSELNALVLQDAQAMQVHKDLSDLIGQAVIVYSATTGQPMAFDADTLSGRQRVVVGTEEEINAIPKVAGIFYCTFEDVT